MTYSGLIALGALAIAGTALRLWIRRGSDGEARPEAAAGDTAVDGTGAAGKTKAGIDPRLVAVMAAAIASDIAADTQVLVRQPGSRVHFWVLSGRQEQVGAVPLSTKWRSGR